MTTYTITEKQNINSHREGYTVEASTLTQAKRAARRNQAFHGTVLVIESNGHTLAATDVNTGKWIAQNYFN